MKKVLLFSFLFFLCASYAQAQAPQSWMLRRYVCGSTPCNTVGNTVEASVTLLPTGLNAVTCNVTVALPSQPINPSTIQWDDPDNAGRFCQWTDPGTGPIVTAVASNTKQYGVTLSRTVTNQATPSAETLLVSFTRPLVIPVPSVPTGLKVAQ